MGDALVQSATIQLKDQGGGVFGSVPASAGGNYINFSSAPTQGATISLTPVSGGFGGFLDKNGDPGVVIQYIKGDEGGNGTPATLQTGTIGASIYSEVEGLGDDTTGRVVTFTNSEVRSGRTLSVQRDGDDNGTYRIGGFGWAKDPSEAVPSVFISYHRHFSADPFNPAGPGVNHKQYYLFGNGTSFDSITNVPQPILYSSEDQEPVQMYANLSGADAPVQNTQGWSVLDTDEWQRWDQWIELDSGAGIADGVMRVWRDNVLGIEDASYLWQPLANLVMADGFRKYVLGHMDTGIPAALTRFSDIYTATSMARVELGNASTWSACTKTEIQPIPETQWGDQTIEDVTLDKGAIAGDSWLYVIKADGTPFSENGESI